MADANPAPESPQNAPAKDSYLQRFIASRKEAAWIIEGSLPFNSTGLLAAAPGSGKSWYLEAMAFAVAGAGPFLGRFPVLRQGPVIIVDQDTAEDQLIQRLYAFNATSPPVHEVVPLPHKGLTLNTRAGRDRLLEHVETHKPVLVIIDTLSKVVSTTFNENDARHIRPVFENISWIQTQFPCTFVLAHHYRKSRTSEDPLAAVRGSSAIVAGADFVSTTSPIDTMGDISRFCVQHIPKRLTMGSGFVWQLETTSVSGDLTKAHSRWIEDVSAQYNHKLEGKKADVLALIRDHGASGATIDDICRELKGLYAPPLIRDLVSSLHDENRLSRRTERHNRGRYFVVPGSSSDDIGIIERA